MTALAQQRLQHTTPGDPTWLNVADTAASRHPVPSEALSIEIVQDRQGFDALESDWDRLHDKASTLRRLPFQSHTWLTSWCDAYLSGRSPNTLRLAIAVVRNGDDVCLICPLAVEHDYGLTRLVWMGAPASQYGDVLIDHDIASSTEIAAALDTVLDHVAPDILRLRRVRADAAIAPILRAGMGAITATNHAPFIDLKQLSSYDAYAARFSAKARKNRRRLRRRLEEKGSVTLRILPPGRRASEAMATALAFKQDWLVRRGEICSALHDRRTHDFLERVVSDRGQSFEPFVSVMSCGDEPVSVQFGIATGNRLALHLIAYNPAWEKAGVGILHTEATIAHAIENGFCELDFLGPDAPYKRAWCEKAIAVDDYVIAPTLSGKLYSEAFLGRSRQCFKSMLAHLPRAVRTHIARRQNRPLADI